MALTRVHAALKPYIEKCAGNASRGIPAIRPDFWAAGSYAASRDEYAYFFGGDMFVAPVIEKGARSRRVYLPAGEWVHFWTGAEHAGGAEYTFAAPLGRPPVFWRRNSEFADVFNAAREAAGTIKL